MLDDTKLKSMLSGDYLMLIAYFVTELFLFFWTKLSVANQMTINESLKNAVTDDVNHDYMVCFLILMIAGAAAWWFIWKRKNPCRVGIMCFLLLLNIGASIAYRTGDRISYKYRNNERIEISHHFMKDYQKDILIMMVVFAIGFLIIRFLPKLYKNTVVNWLISILSIVCFVVARAGSQTDGSYLTVFGVMTFAIVLSVYPMTIGFFMSRSEKTYLTGSVGILSANMFLLLCVSLLLFAGCALTNENGLLLVLGLTLTITFFIGCHTVLAKVAYTGVAAVGCIGIIAISGHIQNRIQIWLDPVKAASNNLKQEAESVLYLFRHFKQSGWYGNGIGDLSYGIYPTLNNDHVLATLINDYSVFFAISVVIVLVILIRWMMNDYQSLDRYDRFFNLACSIVLMCTLLLHVSSNLGSFIVAGVGLPFVSDGSTINYMFTWLLAIHCGLIQRGQKQRTTKGGSI